MDKELAITILTNRKNGLLDAKPYFSERVAIQKAIDAINKVEQQEAQIDLLLTIVNGCEKIAEKTGDTWITQYITDFKNDVIQESSK
ncbi:hypothetical protein P4V41_07585 [Fictibacillus nanhaiensis]|uniref:hypothetical protein n=1 Tax=Fictibacillus nanhaiensis TaxID=742169 RepID=UPI002E23124A|nr:hypothetical protein [Fictibacillus nanhaiensis]